MAGRHGCYPSLIARSTRALGAAVPHACGRGRRPRTGRPYRLPVFLGRLLPRNEMRAVRFRGSAPALAGGAKEVVCRPSAIRLQVRSSGFHPDKAGSIPAWRTGRELVWSFSARLKSERTSFDSTAADCDVRELANPVRCERIFDGIETRTSPRPRRRIRRPLS